MLKTILCLSIAWLLLFVLCPHIAGAQIAPTNSATVSGSVSDTAGKSVVGAKVSLTGPKSITTQTDAQGLFVFVGIPFGTYQVSAAAAGLGTAVRSVSVEGDTNVAIQYTPLSANGLKVIAQVSSSTNAVFNITPASISQVSPRANAFNGQTSWRTILEQIPGVAQAGLANGSEFVASMPNSPLMPMQVSIDGTLPYETAILFDDMPLISGSNFVFSGSGTDLSIYPLNAFDAADVVRGPGANAPSIVDSIGGSLSLHAGGVVTANHYNLSLSTDAYGGVVANAQAAVRWKKLSAVVTYGVNDSPGPINTSTGIFNGLTPATVNGLGFYPYSPPCSPPTCQFGNYLMNPQYNTNSFPYYGFQGGLIQTGVPLSTAFSQHSGSATLSYALSPSTTAVLFYSGQVSAVPYGGSTFTFTFLPPTGYSGAIAPGQYFCDTAQFENGLQTVISSLLEEKITTRLGRGVLRLAALQNHFMDPANVTYPTSGVVQLYGGGCIASSPGGTGGCLAGYAPMVLNGQTYNVTYGYPFALTAIEGNYNRDLSLRYDTPLGENFHGGVSFVKSFYTSYEQETQYFAGSPTFVYSEPPDSSQTTNELRLYAGGNPSAKTSLDLSMYFVNANYHVPNPVGFPIANFSQGTCYYNSASSNGWVNTGYSYSAPRLGFVWRPSATIAIRAALGGGFAEAPVNDLVGSSAPSFDSTLGAYTVSQPNLNLQPEKSFAFTLGTDIRLHRDTILSFDLYHANLFGQFYGTTTHSTIVVGGITYPLYIDQTGNLGESRYEGILADVHHDMPHGTYWSFAGGFTRGFVVSVPGGFHNNASGACNFTTGTTPDGNPCPNLNVIRNINFNGTFAASIPYAQASGTLGYRWNPEKYLDLAGIYYGNNNTYFRPAFIILNGHVGYPLSKNTSLLLTFENITGRYDGSIQVWSPSNMSGAPLLSGAPNALYGEMYGPRTVILTTSVHF